MSATIPVEVESGVYSGHRHPQNGYAHDAKPVRDLTGPRVAQRSRRSEMASDYRDARDAYEATMEAVAIGYATEEREYRAENPPPEFRQFVEEYAR